MWTSENESVKFWLQVVTEKKSRGVTTGSGLFHYFLTQGPTLHRFSNGTPLSSVMAILRLYDAED